jgi:hypothetical protein
MVESLGASLAADELPPDREAVPPSPHETPDSVSPGE